MAPQAKLGLAMSVSGDNVTVAVAAGVGGISLASVANGSLRKVEMGMHGAPPGPCGTIRRVKMSSFMHSQVNLPKVHANSASSVSFYGPNSLVSCGDDGQCLVWDLRTQQVSMHILADMNV